MFDEYGCGCIISMQQGRVRICVTHRPKNATGSGAVEMMGRLGKIVRQYPANGEMPKSWK